jgi:hypothetical protein
VIVNHLLHPESRPKSCSCTRTMTSSCQSDQFSESERVALEYAEAVTLRSDAIEEPLMERLREPLSLGYARFTEATSSSSPPTSQQVRC